MNTIKIKEALALAHYCEAKERGSQRMNRNTAAQHAAKTLDLNEQEKKVLYDALIIQEKYRL